MTRRFPIRCLLLPGLFSVLAGLSFAQIAEYPYEASFGSTQQPGVDNVLWKTYAFSSAKALVANPSSQWGFRERPSGEGLCPAFWADGTLEFVPALFSPQFRLEKQEGLNYELNVRFYVPEGGGFLTGENLIVRLNSCSQDGEPYFEMGLVDDQDPVLEGDELRSLWLGTIENGPAEGYVSYTFRFKSELIRQEGSFRFAFIVLGTPPMQKGRIYLSDFRVEALSGSDLAAGQILSPLTSMKEGRQDVSFFVRNTGTTAVGSVSACYQVDGGMEVRQDFPDLDLQPRQTRRLVFDVPADLREGRHSIRFWLEQSDDVNRDNDSSDLYFFEIGPAMSASEANFDFSAPGQGRSWTAYSDSLELAPFWQFGQGPLSYAPQASTSKKENPDGHDDCLATPYLHFEKDRIYKIELDYQAVLSASEVLGKKPFSVWLAQGNGRHQVLSPEKRLWNGVPLENTDNRTVSFFYRPEQEGDACLVFRSSGVPSDGAVRLNRFSIAYADTNRMDFVYDFDPLSSSDESDARSQAGKHLVFVDQDGNIAKNSTSTACWEVYGNASGNGNSAFSARAAGLNGTANDWMVFYPVFLRAGSTYHMSLYAKAAMAADDRGTPKLELFLQETCPDYDLDYAQQPGKKAVIEGLQVGYRKYSYRIEVEKDAFYFLSVRNRTSVVDWVGGEEAAKYAVYVDNVVLSSRDLNSVQALEAEIPYDARLGRQEVELSMVVRNFSDSSVRVSDLAYCYRIDQGPVVREDPPGDLVSQAMVAFKFTEKADFSSDGDHTVSFWVETRGSADAVDTVRKEVRRIYAKVLPFEDGFGPSSVEEWQSYPLELDSWFLSEEAEMAFSRPYAMAKKPLDFQGKEYLVSPLLKVKKDTAYRVSFRYKRRLDASENDSVGLYYAYDRFDLRGFNSFGKVYPAHSGEYAYVVAYLRFPKDGEAYVALGDSLSPRSQNLYVDDFSIADSVFAHTSQIVLGNLRMPSGLSVSDTASRDEIGFWVGNRGFLDVESVILRYGFDRLPLQEMKTGRIARNDSVFVRIPVRSMPAGDHDFRVWADLPQEGNRQDDTSYAVFSVRGMQSFPFVENFEGEVPGTGAVDVNRDGKTWDVVRNFEDAREGNSCLAFRHLGAKAGDVFFTDGFRLDEAGRYCLSFYMKAEGEGSDSIGVRLMEYGASGFSKSGFLMSVVPDREYRRYAIAFQTGSAGGYAIAFDYFSEGVRQEFFIDSISVDRIPVPVTPSQLTVVADTFSARFRCQGGEPGKVLRVYGKNGDFDRSYVWNGSGSFVVSGLEAGTAYQASVRSLNLVGDSSRWSEAVSFTTLSFPDDSDSCPVPQILKVQADTFFAVFSCESRVREKVLRIYASDGSFDRFYAWSGQTDFRAEGLSAGTAYVATLRAVCVPGDSSRWSEAVRFETLKAGSLSNRENPAVGKVLSVRPNPFSEHLCFDVPDWAERWQLRDIRGRVIRSARLAGSSRHVDLDLRDLLPGMYFLRVEGYGRTEVEKIIKK